MNHLRTTTCSLVILGLAACGPERAESESVRWAPEAAVSALGVEIWEAKGTGERVELSGFRRVDGKEERLVHGTLVKLPDQVTVDVDQPAAWHFESKAGSSPVTSGDAPPEIGLALASSVYALAVQSQPKSTSALSIHATVRTQDLHTNNGEATSSLLSGEPQTLLTSTECLLSNVSQSASTVITTVTAAVEADQKKTAKPNTADPAPSSPTGKACSWGHILGSLLRAVVDYDAKAPTPNQDPDSILGSSVWTAPVEGASVESCRSEYSRAFDYCVRNVGDNIAVGRNQSAFNACLDSVLTLKLLACCAGRPSCSNIKEQKLVDDECAIAYAKGIRSCNNDDPNCPRQVANARAQCCAAGTTSCGK